MGHEFELTEATIEAIHDAYEAGALTCEGLVRTYLDRIRAYDENGPGLNAVVTTSPNATDRAADLDAAFESTGLVGPLHGIPVVVKDQIETSDVGTTFGSEAFADYEPAADAPLVARLRDAGAVVLAKTNLPDWASSWFGYSSVVGRTKNPYALERDPGGSSSGTGAAVAANLGTVGIGEDTGGSIRLPAAYNNLVGIRPTVGLVSRTGVSPRVRSEDTPGPMARSVADLATVLDVLVGYDPADEYTAATELAADAGSYADDLERDALDGARIGVLRDQFGDRDDPAAGPVTRTVEDAIAVTADAGAEVVDPVRVPSLDDHLDATSLYVLESKRDLNDFLASRDGAPVDSVDELYESGQYHPILERFVRIAEEGLEDPEDHVDYWHGLEAQLAFQREVLSVFADHDLDALLCPVSRTVPPKASAIEAGEFDRAALPTNTVIASQARLCAVSLPAGFTGDGLPVGVELVGKPYDESTLLSLAYAYECAADPRRPPATAPPLDG